MNTLFTLAYQHPVVTLLFIAAIGVFWLALPLIAKNSDSEHDIED